MEVNSERLFNTQAEDGVIAGLIGTVNDEKRDSVFQLLDKNDFYSAWHKEVYGVCHDLWATGRGIDYVTVSDKITEPDRLNTALRSGSVNTLTHARIVKELSARRSVAETGRELLSLASNRNLPVEDVIDTASSALFKANDIAGKNTMISAASCASGVMAEISRRMTNPGRILGIESGYRSIDNVFGGWHTKKLIILAARPAMGKTALMLNALARSAVRKHVPSLCFSLEMSSEELTWRMMPILSRVDNNLIKSGTLDQQDFQSVQYASDLFSRSPLLVDDAPKTLNTISVAVRNAVRRHRVKLVFVDYLQMIGAQKGKKREDTRDRELTEIAYGLKELAKETDTCIVALSQLNRSVEYREDKRPIMADLRESGGLEQAADDILMLYRPVVYDEEADPNEAQVLVRKHRNGELATIPMFWDGARFLFEDISHRTTGVPTI